MTSVFLGLGSNLGNRESHLLLAIDRLSSSLHEIITAPIYETQPLDFQDQPDFLNTVIQGKTSLSPHSLLRAAQEVERLGGRIRDTALPQGPRSIDVDILLYGNRIVEGNSLCIPHPSMGQRLFVLRPLLHLAPHLADPVDGVPWASKAAGLAGQGVFLYTGSTKAEGRS